MEIFNKKVKKCELELCSFHIFCWKQNKHDDHILSYSYFTDEKAEFPWNVMDLCLYSSG